MHGFQDGTAFRFLCGATVQQICLGQYETILRLSPATTITLEGRYVHHIPSQGREIAQARSACGSNELFRLLGESVTEAVVLSPDSLKLCFSNGDCLLLIDDSEQYESFMIQSAQGSMVI
jgi:hypothetical protein